jgi:tartrate-resistant acid phosphatase type 5
MLVKVKTVLWGGSNTIRIYNIFQRIVPLKCCIFVTSYDNEALQMRHTVILLVFIVLTGQAQQLPQQEIPITFSIIGDYGAAGPNEESVSRLMRRGFLSDFIITTGDNNYPKGEAETIDTNIGYYFSGYIVNYHGKYGVSSNKHAFLPSLGNGDWKTDSAKPYLDYFTLPGNERYYDTIIGCVHLFCIDSDTNEPDGVTADSKQAMWLKDKLEKAGTDKWNIVYFHHPPYSSDSTNGSSEFMRWPFKEWGASVVMSGHAHVYERLEVDGLPYYVNGLGGASKYLFGTPLPESKFRYNKNYGLMRCEANASYMKLWFVSIDNIGMDTLIISGIKDVHDKGNIESPILYPTWPNPSSGSATIEFFLPTVLQTTIEVVDLFGNSVFRESAVYSEGKHSISFQRKDDTPASSYLVRMRTLSFQNSHLLHFIE